MGVVVGILGVGPDVVLNHRREGGFTKVPVTIDPRIDEKIHVVGVSSSLGGDSRLPRRPRDAGRCDGFRQPARVT